MDPLRIAYFERSNYLSTKPVFLHTPKIEQVVEVKAGELGFAQYLVTEFTSALHDGAQHLVVTSTRKEDFACIEFEEGAPNRPHVDGKIIRHTED